jgi:photosystem II stability/assembly factor-like uncharacterized protein
MHSIRMAIALLLAGVASVVTGRPVDVWSSIVIPGESGRIQAVAVGTDGTVYVGTDRHGVYRSADGLTWTAGAGPIATADVFGLAADPLRSGIVFAATLGGVLRSTDGGVTWAAANQGLLGDAALAVAIVPGLIPTVYVGTAVALFKSTDDGMSWTKAWTTLTNDGVSAIAIAPTAPSVIYAGTFAFGRPGPAPVGSGVFKSTDGGLSWSAVNTGLGGSAVFSVAVDPADPATVLAAVEGGAYKTASGGGTWTRVLAASVGAIAFDPTQEATVYAGGADVFRSTDAGAGWLVTEDGLVSPDSPAAGVLCLAVDRSGRVYAGTAVKGLFRGTFSQVGNCSEDGSTICLGSGRFRVTVEWQVASQGTAGAGHARSLSVDGGAFWFFTPNNIELVVKVVDGRAFNERFWVFAGALTDVAYTLRVEDTVTGAAKTYANAQGTLASLADTNAFAP